MTRTYVLTGEPIAYRDFKAVKNTWDEWKQEQLRRSIELEQQMGEQKIMGGPVELEFVFSFDVTKGRQHTIESKHTHKPTIDDLIRYIHMLCRNKLYIPESVVSVKACKQYSNEATTQLTISKV